MGRYCSLAGSIHYFGANHPINNISSSAYFYNKSFSGLDVKDVPRGTLDISDDVWIGYGAIITNSCHNIGRGAVIGAGSIVTRDIPAYSIVAGNPAHLIRYRFKTDEIKEIENSKWWKKTPEELYKYYKYIDDPVEFTNRLRNE